MFNAALKHLERLRLTRRRCSLSSASFSFAEAWETLYPRASIYSTKIKNRKKSL